MTSVSRPWAIWLMTTCAACGGTAIIDPPGDAGSGGAGAGTATGTGTGTGTSTGTSTGSSPLAAACEQACDQLVDCVTLSEDCVGGCNATAGPCDPEHIAMLTCYRQAQEASCYGPYVDCFETAQDYADCREAGSIAGGCSASGPSSCACTFAGDGTKLYESDCTDDLCDCYANGDYVGTCLQEPEATQLCALPQTCCYAMVLIAAPL